MADFQRPAEYKIDQTKIFAEMLITNDMRNPDTGQVVDIKIAPFLIETELQDDGSLPVLPIDEKLFTDDKFIKMDKLIYSLGKINRLAELNLDSVKNFVRYYFSTTPFQEFVNGSNKCEDQRTLDISDNYSKLSFMQLKGLLSCILKTDNQFHTIPELDSNEKRNSFTKMYTDYVYDRDCYTHGGIFFHYPDFEPIMRVKPPGKEEHYIGLTEQILWDNVSTYKLLSKAVDDMREILDKKRIQANP